MPTYEYVCRECGEQLETVQSFADPPLVTCTACGGPLRKVFGNVGIVFKGSGFYKTDSRASSNGSGKASTHSDGSGSSVGSRSSEGSSGANGASGSGGSSSTPTAPAPAGTSAS